MNTKLNQDALSQVVREGSTVKVTVEEATKYSTFVTLRAYRLGNYGSVSVCVWIDRETCDLQKAPMILATIPGGGNVFLEESLAPWFAEQVLGPLKFRRVAQEVSA